jgi:hypothetical protein
MMTPTITGPIAGAIWVPLRKIPIAVPLSVYHQPKAEMAITGLYISAITAPPRTMKEAEPRPVRHLQVRKEAKFEVNAVPPDAKNTSVLVIMYAHRRP